MNSPQPEPQSDSRKTAIGPPCQLRVLVVDDSRAQRRLLTTYLSRWGFDVQEAGSGEEALGMCRESRFDIVVSDWMMPQMNGLEFLRAFRELDTSHYGYFILLTSRSEKGEVAEGLEKGADDFLVKPVSALELRARIRAGERILAMEREMQKKNRMIADALDRISTLYDAIEGDLIEASNLQKSLLRERERNFGGSRVSLMWHPSGHVGGDLVGFFEIAPERFGIYALDVSGHGVASALMTARIAGYLSGHSPDQNLALSHAPDGTTAPRSPAEAVMQINRLIMEEMETELYFTMILGHFDNRTGKARLVQCGHPPALVQKADGGVAFHGDGGLPVGLIADAQWEDIEVQLQPGDRLLLYSDGITECGLEDGSMLGEHGLAALMRRNARLRGQALLDTLMWDLVAGAEAETLDDDVSALLIEYSPMR